MRLLWCLMAIVAIVASKTASEPQLLQALSQSRENFRNSQIEQILRDLLESLRDTILNGSGVIPPLDPLEVSQVNLDDNTIPLPGAQVSLTDATVSNLATFEVDKLSVTMTSLLLQRYRIELDARIPVLEAEADEYDIGISALGYNIFGNGKLKLRIREPKISANVEVGVSLFGSNGISLVLRSCTVKFSLTAFEPEITGLFGHEGASDFVNLFLKDLVPTLVDVYEPEITKFLSETVFDVASNLLADLDLGDLIRP
ncbi:hypothetical protein ABMA27_011506 [Loxostege sticticalis]|uniref:Uncharacterized protein n=1 Tax=Loxostege sticticalis TaxID=481309 RepID=A0ABR3IGI7_LOXSC